MRESWTCSDQCGAYGKMLDHINEQAEEIAILLGWHGKEIENLANNAAIDACTAAPGFHQRWQDEDEVANE